MWNNTTSLKCDSRHKKLKCNIINFNRINFKKAFINKIYMCIYNFTYENDIMYSASKIQCLYFSFGGRALKIVKLGN